MKQYAYLSIKFGRVIYNKHAPEICQKILAMFSGPDGGGFYDHSGVVPRYFNSIRDGRIEDFGTKDEIYDNLIACGVKPWEIKAIEFDYVRI